MLRRTVFALLTAVALSAGRAEAVTIRDLIELTKAGLSDPVLLALIEVDRSVFTIDTATLKQLKAAGVSDQVIVALIRSGRQPRPEPVAVPVYVPVPSRRSFDTRDTRHTIETTFPTDVGLVRARVPVPPNCVKAEPVYWGFGGKLRPGSWEPPPTVVCR